MTYQVLARKWRPRTFAEMVGQEHVLKALTNALAQGRLHHAYLFTGTRGVGKTTVARALAKCLNCETGITPEPCGRCGACVEISEGRFVDLIEVDAASRTRVEDTRELLDNVQYTPSRGRFKIYLVDEVHMLSQHSFNALLKTLEEPPEHVKFLLATTDPQKLPVTVLSRCLQFNLKNLSSERIAGHLAYILQREQILFEAAALDALAKAAAGSMRDALSLTDQAIGHGGGQVLEADVRAMLGTIDRRLIEQLLQALVARDALALMAAVSDFAEQAADYSGALEDLAQGLHQLAVAQIAPEAVLGPALERERLAAIAARLSPSAVQLCYQIALLGRRDLHLAPDPRAGFEMVLLRMLHFGLGGPTLARADAESREAVPPGPVVTSAATAPMIGSAPLAAAGTPAAAAMPAPPAVDLTTSEVPQAPLTELRQRETAPTKKPDPAPPARVLLQELQAAPRPTPSVAPQPQLQTASPPQPQVAPPPTSAPPAELSWPPTAETWPALFAQLALGGVLKTVAGDMALVSADQKHLRFALSTSASSLFDPAHEKRLASAISEGVGREVAVTVSVTELEPSTITPRRARAAALAELQLNTARELARDPVIKGLEAAFDISLDPAAVWIDEAGGAPS